MRKWGIVISLFYALIVLGLLVPSAALLSGPDWWRNGEGIQEAYREWVVWIPIAIVLGGQALLLFLSVDTSWKRLRPRAHILVSCSIAAILTTLLALAVISSIGSAVRGDDFIKGEGSFAKFLVFLGVLWLFWGILFYLFLRNSSAVVNRIMS